MFSKIGTTRLAFGAAALLAVSVAIAQPAPNPYPECNRKPTPADVEGAKGAHKAASQFYDRGNYENAIRYWNDAYSFDCTAHGVLLNIANAHEKKGDKQSAVTALETYLKRAGNDPTIEEKVKNLKQQLAPPPTVTAPPTAPPTSTASAPPPPPSASASSAPPDAPRPFGFAPWIVVGVGGAALLTGAILIPLGLGDVSQAEKECPTRKGCSQATTDLGNAGRTKVGAGGAMVGIGVAAVAGGLVWQLVFNKPVAKNAKTGGRTFVAPMLGPNVGGAVVNGAF